MNKISVIVAAAATTLSLGQAARAQAPTSAYVSVSAGPTLANLDCSDTSSCNRSNVGAKVLVGYRIVPSFAVEASYAYLGRYKATSSFDGDVGSASISGQSLGLGLAGLFPFGGGNEWTAIVRGGVAVNRSHVSASLDGESASDSETHAEPYVGLGLSYALSPAFDAGIAWDLTKIGYGDASSRVHTFSIVGTLKF